MTSIEKAILDVIAYAEGTLGASQNGYDIAFNFKKIIGWTKDTDIIHGNKDWATDFKNDLTTAAGRYQFIGSTWIGINGDKNVPMTKENQDNAAIKLVKRRLGQTIATKKKVTISEFRIISL